MDLKNDKVRHSVDEALKLALERPVEQYRVQPGQIQAKCTALLIADHPEVRGRITSGQLERMVQVWDNVQGALRIARDFQANAVVTFVWNFEDSKETVRGKRAFEHAMCSLLGKGPKLSEALAISAVAKLADIMESRDAHAKAKALAKQALIHVLETAEGDVASGLTRRSAEVTSLLTLNPAYTRTEAGRQAKRVEDHAKTMAIEVRSIADGSALGEPIGELIQTVRSNARRYAAVAEEAGLEQRDIRARQREILAPVLAKLGENSLSERARRGHFAEIMRLAHDLEMQDVLVPVVTAHYVGILARAAESKTPPDAVRGQLAGYHADFQDPRDQRKILQAAELVAARSAYRLAYEGAVVDYTGRAAALDRELTG